MRRMRMIGTALLSLALLAAACGGGGNKTPSGSGNKTSSGSGGGGASCSPNGTTIALSVKNIHYSASCIAAPGNTAFTIDFNNQDSLPHNVEIFSDAAMTQSVFKGDIVNGPKQATYNVSALAPGTYHFHCDIHPTQMQGTLIVR